MKNVVCLKHPKYNPTHAPDLSCRVCCEKYVDRIKQTQDYFRAQGSFTGGVYDRRKVKRS